MFRLPFNINNVLIVKGLVGACNKEKAIVKLFFSSH